MLPSPLSFPPQCPHLECLRKKRIHPSHQSVFLRVNWTQAGLGLSGRDFPSIPKALHLNLALENKSKYTSLWKGELCLVEALMVHKGPLPFIIALFTHFPRSDFCPFFLLERTGSSSFSLGLISLPLLQLLCWRCPASWPTLSPLFLPTLASHPVCTLARDLQHVSSSVSLHLILSETGSLLLLFSSSPPL